MLIYSDSSSLGDTHLSPEEGVAKLKEGNKKLDEKFKLPNQDMLENADMALGEPMQPSEFIRRLEKLNPEIIIEKGGVPGAVAVRIRSLDNDKESPTYGTYVKKYLTGFYVDGVLAEFSRILTDKHGRPTRHMRGWRTVLLDLNRLGALPYDKIKAAFGEPKGQRGILWQEQTQAQRT